MRDLQYRSSSEPITPWLACCRVWPLAHTPRANLAHSHRLCDSWTMHPTTRTRTVPDAFETKPLPAGLLERLATRAFTAGETRERAAVVAPFTGEVLGHVPLATAVDVREAVRRARRAQAAWAARPFRERARVLLRFHDFVLENAELAQDLVQWETGKARRHAFEEVADVALVARYYARHGGRHLRPRRRRGAIPLLTIAWEERRPVGVVGLIAPWNYPLSLAVGDALPALVAGNAAVLKPDPLTPFAALWAADLLREAGLPDDLFHVVVGEGPVVGPPLIDGVDHVAFTGSTGTGKIVSRQAAERLIGCSLELGGKNAMVVLDDADLDRAVDGAIRGAFANAGQLCISIERIYVHDTLHDRFAERFVERVRALRLGPGFDPALDMGSLISARQLETVRRHVEDALAKGARLLAGGSARPDLGPFFFEPTVLAGVTPEMELYAQETFGPVVALYRFRDEEELVRRVNENDYGLNASIWTRDVRRGRSLARRIHAGTVNLNEAYGAAWGSVDAPMGGFKDSGLGRRHGAEGILRFTEAQTIAAQRILPLGPPPGADAAPFARRMIRALRLVSRIPGLR